MPLNKQGGNMYGFVDYTWNTIKGLCPHGCKYCYMKRFPQTELHFDEKELKANLGSGNRIFVGSSCDMWAETIPTDWITRTLEKCRLHNDNIYIFQSKNPKRFDDFNGLFPRSTFWITTIETNRFYPDIMGNAPRPQARLHDFQISQPLHMHITVEPIMDFDTEVFAEMLGETGCRINIGADSCGHNLPEPSKEKVIELIDLLENEYCVEVYQKKNLKRILGEDYNPG